MLSPYGVTVCGEGPVLPASHLTSGFGGRSSLTARVIGLLLHMCRWLLPASLHSSLKRLEGRQQFRSRQFPVPFAFSFFFRQKFINVVECRSSVKDWGGQPRRNIIIPDGRAREEGRRKKRGPSSRPRPLGRKEAQGAKNADGKRKGRKKRRKRGGKGGGKRRRKKDPI